MRKYRYFIFEGNWRRDGPLLLVVSREFLEEKGLGPSVAPILKYVRCTRIGTAGFCRMQDTFE